MKPGDVVHHLRSGQRLYVEDVDGRTAFCAWFDASGEIQRMAFGVAWLVEKGVGLA